MSRFRNRFSGALAGSALVLSVCLPTSAFSSSTVVAAELANLLASEGPCDLSFDADAIMVWIDNNVEPGDLNFSYMLEGLRAGSELTVSELEGSQKIAHCHAVKRAASHFGFIHS